MTCRLSCSAAVDSSAVSPCTSRIILSPSRFTAFHRLNVVLFPRAWLHEIVSPLSRARRKCRRRVRGIIALISVAHYVDLQLQLASLRRASEDDITVLISIFLQCIRYGPLPLLLPRACSWYWNAIWLVQVECVPILDLACLRAVSSGSRCADMEIRAFSTMKHA